MTTPESPKHIVLYADDDMDDLQLVKEAFAGCRHDVELVTVNDGAEALLYLNNLPEAKPAPCLIILDINMPRLNGKETLVKLRQSPRFRKVSIMLFTTSAMPADAAFAERYGASFYTKPTDGYKINKLAKDFIDRCSEEIEGNRKAP